MLTSAKNKILEFFTVEKNIPLPSLSKSRRNKYPFGKMVIGDSFVVHGEERNVVRSAAYEYGRRHEMRFVTRADGEGMRVWRLS